MFTVYNRQALLSLFCFLSQLITLQAQQCYILTPNTLKKVYKKKFPNNQIEQDILFGKCAEIREALKAALSIKCNSIEQALTKAGFVKAKRLIACEKPEYILHERLSQSTLPETLSVNFSTLLYQHFIKNLEEYFPPNRLKTILQINLNNETASCSCFFVQEIEKASLSQQIKE